MSSRGSLMTGVEGGVAGAGVAGVGAAAAAGAAVVGSGRLNSSGSRQTGLISLSSGSGLAAAFRSEEHTSELQSLMRISYAVFCLAKKPTRHQTHNCVPSH